MATASRTPEGTPGRCPVCGAAVQVEPSQPWGDAPCPACGSLLWFVAHGGERRYFAGAAANAARRRLRAWLAERLGVDPARLDVSTLDAAQLPADSLDLVELVMELEDEFPSSEQSAPD